MRIGLFSDPHYSSAEITCGKRYNSASLAKIAQAMAAFKAEDCDMAIILGDVTDTEVSKELEIGNLREVSEVFSASGMEIVCLMGNHDAFVFEADEFYSIIGEKYRPGTICRDGVNLVFLDACYFSDGRRYMPGDTDWTDTFLPDTARLKEELGGLEGRAFVFMHQNIDPNIPEDHRLSNAAEVRRILEESGIVDAVYQGHYHPGKRSEVNGIKYTALSAMCENEGAFWIKDL